MQDEIRERLADYAHEAWSGWMRYLFSRSLKESDGCVLIPSELVERWTRQMNTPYTQLPDNEQESDRVEADKMLTIMKGISS